MYRRVAQVVRASAP